MSDHEEVETIVEQRSRYDGVAVLVPCFNEELTVADVVRDFRAALPGAVVYVYDNNSTDGTAARARDAGAVVRSAALKGKGNVVRRMFADAEADIVIMVDGDATYDASVAPLMVDLIGIGGNDLVNASRVPVHGAAYPRGHELGNRLLSGIVKSLFSRQVEDMLSGYKAMSRRFVKSFPVFSSGFEIETEITVHALELRIDVAEVSTEYCERPAGSESKLSTYRDGFRISRLIASLVRQSRPLLFYSAIGTVLCVACLALGLPLVTTFLHTHKVPRLPTAVLVVGLMVLAALSFTMALVVDAVTRSRREGKMLRYLAIAGPLTAKGTEATSGVEAPSPPRIPEPAEPGDRGPD
jgi:glycosyltransferase involved in cell wall biosynthesis